VTTNTKPTKTQNQKPSQPHSAQEDVVHARFPHNNNYTKKRNKHKPASTAKHNPFAGNMSMTAPFCTHFVNATFNPPNQFSTVLDKKNANHHSSTRIFYSYTTASYLSLIMETMSQ
jgi:hypothetical protein